MSAMSDEVITVKAAIHEMTQATSSVLRKSVPSTPVKARMMQNTPTFTTATACSSAETGVGATIAFGSQEWKGMTPALAKPKVNNSSKTSASQPLTLPARKPPLVKSIAPSARM